MSISDISFFQWFTDNESPTFFDKEQEEFTPYLYGFSTTLFALIIFPFLIYHFVKVLFMQKSVTPRDLSWMFITRVIIGLVMVLVTLASWIIALVYKFLGTSIYNENSYDSNEGYAYYIIIPGVLMSIEWCIVIINSYFERKRWVYVGLPMQIFILGGMALHFIFIRTRLFYEPHKSLDTTLKYVYMICGWSQGIGYMLYAASLLFKQEDRFINPEYRRVATTNKEELDADRENTIEDDNEDPGSIHFTPLGNREVSESYQNDTLALLRNNQPVDSRAKPSKPFLQRLKHAINFITFSNITEVLGFTRGYQKGMNMDISDIEELNVEKRANFLTAKFENAWNKAKQNGKPKLLRVMFALNKGPMLLAIIPRLIFDVTLFVPILAQYFMIMFGQAWMDAETDQSGLGIVDDIAGSLPWYYQKWFGIFFGCIICLSAVINSFAGHYFTYLVTLVGQNMRSSLIMAMYEHIFSMSNKAFSTTPHGQILNMMSVDANCVNDMCTQIHLMWSCTLEVVVGIAWLFVAVSYNAVPGLLIMFGAVFFNVIIARFTVKQMRALMQIKDTRVKLLTEVLNSIKTVKVMVWERHLHGQLHSTRKKEVTRILWVIAYRSSMNFIVWAIPPLVAFSTYGLITIVAGGDANALTPESAFISLGLFNIMRLPLIKFPKLLNDCMQGFTSMKRIQGFLLNGEDNKDDDNIITAVSTASPDAPVIAVENASFSWEDNDAPALNDINFKAHKGQLIGIIGEVGCGKTAFFKMLLGNLHKTSGVAYYSGSMGYVAQNAWVQNLTVHDNIVFGRKHDTDHYERVIAACELRNDLENFQGGDQMEVGMEGSNLSGGQKQRLSLARATYQNADIYLLDDCLSAVDANVGKNIFNNCFKGVLKEKTRILITQTFQYLPDCDYIYVMKNNTFVEAGTFAELNAQTESEFTRLYSNYAANVSHEDENGSRILKRKIKKGVKASQLIAKENLQQYANAKTLWSYVRYGGIFYFLSLLVFFFLSSFLLIGSNFWLVIWTDESKKENMGAVDDLTGYGLLGWYGVLVIISLIFIVLRFVFLAAFNGKASIKLHFDALNRVLNSPMAFFQSTPIGRILNRFSENLFVIDDKINLSLAQFIASIMMCAVTVIATIASSNLMISVFAVSLYYFFYVMSWYITYAKQLLRLDMVSRSPLYNSFQESLKGIDTIKIMKNNHRFTSILSNRLNKQQKVYYATNICQRWLGVRVELVGSICLGCVIIFGSIRILNTSPSLIALLIMYMFQFNSLLNNLLQSTVEVQQQSTAIQAVCEYLDLVPERGITDDDPEVSAHVSPQWPEHGDVKFDKVTMSYNPNLPPAVNDLSVHVTPGETVGIVGRTGAGKSSIMVSLFRLYEMDSGSITIDGVKTNQLSLNALRSGLCVIPQEPVLFRGTLRKNLDILGKHTDEELWQVLDDVNLKDHITSKGEGLDLPIAEGGSNFSIGERQLFCLARGLLSRSKVIVLDEATANVDLQTEKRIFNALFTHCKGSTMFMIAHRLHTILTCDKILMLEKGHVVGFDTPDNLKKTCPEFASLVAKTGFDKEETDDDQQIVQPVIENTDHSSEDDGIKNDNNAQQPNIL